MWILLWLGVTAGGNMENYYLGTFPTKEECVSELSKAHVIVKSKNSAIDCIYIELDESYIKLKNNK
tara:strand:- start:2125 stop:2322 length:198 start_codon:yes stop_codon:yes gene_type:complete